MRYKFETLQLHVGQEQPDPATDARRFLSTRPPAMCFGIPPTPPPGLAWRMPETYTGG